MRVLTELKLPKASRPTTRSIMQSTSLIETPTAERLRQLEAQEGDLEETLETIDGVTSASIELVVPAPSRPGVPPVPSKASVLLRVRPEALEHLQQQRGELRALVAGSVEGLKVDDVVLVVDEIALQPAAAPSAPLPSAHGDLRGLVIALGLCLVVLAVLLIMLSLRLRAAGRAPVNEPPAERPAPPAAPRPTVNAAVQRKVA
jgi:type III secretion protein J